jgi:2-C-methyl-D-erythritol 4-phosphate cytidylyltransferase
MNIAVILAGGKGSRLDASLPKQFLSVGGHPIIAYSINAFEKNENIDEIAIVIPSSYLSLWESIEAQNNWKKIKHVLSGGDERHLSTLAALHVYNHVEEATILFHDAARPLVSQRIINDTLQLLKQYKAVTVAMTTADTILCTDDTQRMIENIPDRNYLRRVQTPQGFHLSVIRKAYELAVADNDFIPTDDCSVVKKYLPHEKTGLAEGHESNFKVTYPQDIFLLEKLLEP